MDFYNGPTKDSTNHGNEVLSKNILHPMQGTCNKRRGPQPNHRRSPDHGKQTEIVWARLTKILPEKDHPARHRQGKKNNRKTKEEVRGQHMIVYRLRFSEIQSSDGITARCNGVVVTMYYSCVLGIQ